MVTGTSHRPLTSFFKELSVCRLRQPVFSNCEPARTCACRRLPACAAFRLSPDWQQCTSYRWLACTMLCARLAQVHAKGKPIPRGGDEVWESDALLHRVAELTIGYAGADLANLLNEAAILMVGAPFPPCLCSSYC